MFVKHQSKPGPGWPDPLSTNMRDAQPQVGSSLRGNSCGSESHARHVRRISVCGRGEATGASTSTHVRVHGRSGHDSDRKSSHRRHAPWGRLIAFRNR
jgi:hypothetical protein